MKDFIVVLAIFSCICSPTYPFIDLVGDLISGGQKAKQNSEMINALFKMVDILGDLSLVSKNQSSDIYQIYKHYERLDSGNYFMDTVNENLDYNSRQDIWKAQSTINDISELNEMLQPNKSKELDSYVSSVREDRKKVKSLSQSGKKNMQIKMQGQNVEINAVNLEQNRKLVAYTEERKINDAINKKKYDEAFKDNKLESVQEKMELYRRYGR